MAKYNGVMPNKKIYINKSHKETKCSNGTVMHNMIFSDSHKDQTGTYISDGTYSIRWWDNEIYYDKEKVTIGSILKVEYEKFQDRAGNIRDAYVITVTIVKDGQPNQMNQYGGNKSGYTPQYQTEPQYQVYNGEDYGDY